MVWKNNLRYKYFEYREIDETLNKSMVEFKFTSLCDLEEAEKSFIQTMVSYDTKRVFYPFCYSFQNNEGHTILRYLSGMLDYEYYQRLGNHKCKK